MKLKLLRSVTPLVLTFLISIAFVSLPTNKIIGKFFQKDITPEAKVKLYNFFLSEKNLYLKMGKDLSESPLLDRIGIIIEFNKSREKMDTSELPEDFQNAWEKLTVSDLHFAEFILHLRQVSKDGQAIIKTTAQKEIIDKQITENNQLRKTFLNVSKSYGIEFDENDNFVEK